MRKEGRLCVAWIFGQLCLIRAGMEIGLLLQRAALLFDDLRPVFMKVADLRLQQRVSLIRRALCKAIPGALPEHHADNGWLAAAPR